MIQATLPPNVKRDEPFGNEPIRVLHLLHNLKREGAQSVVTNLVLASRRTAVMSFILAWKESGPLAELLRESGIHVADPWTGPRWRAPAYLRDLISRFRIDILHAHMSDSAILGAAGARSLDVHLVITHHSNRLFPSTGVVTNILRRASAEYAVRRAAINVAVTPAVRDQVHRTFRLPERNTHCILNGVPEPPCEYVDAAQAQRLSRSITPPFGPKIVAVGRLVDLKRQISLIRAMRLVIETFPEATLSILGDGPLRATLLQETQTLDLGAHVKLPGVVSNVAEFLRDADMFVSTSRHEGLPIAVLEAMSWGLPVVVTDVPGHRDVVQPDVNGIVVPFDDVAALGEGIIRLLRDRDLRVALGERARVDVSQRYGSAVMARAYEELYRRALAASRADSGRGAGD